MSNDASAGDLAHLFGNVAYKDVESLEIVCKSLNAMLGAIVQPVVEFRTRNTTTLVAKKRSGDYKQVAVSAGSSFVPTGCYMGKRGKILYIFRPANPIGDQYAFYELPMDRENLLIGFRDVVLEKMEKITGHRIMPHQIGDLEARKEIAATVAATKALELNPLFGSW